MTTKRKSTSEAPALKQTSEVETNVSTSEVEVAKIALDEYLKVAKVNPGLVASYRTEGWFHPELMEPKTEDEWAAAFVDQSARVYK